MSAASVPRVAVVGGGITGLCAAHRLAELGVTVTLIERGERCGGVVLTERVDGFLLEAGPDSFLARKPSAAALCRRIELGHELLPPDPARRGSFVLLGGRLHPLPEGLTSLVPTRLGPLARTRLLSVAAKARLMAEPLLPRRNGSEDESLAGFFRRRLGEEASRRLVEPLVRGIYGGDPGTLSLRATFPHLAELERRHGSIVLGLLRAPRGAGPATGGFLSLRRGMGSLPERLAERLPAGALRTGAGVGNLRRAGGRAFELALEGGGTLAADAVILALPPREAARVLGGLDAEAAASLDAFPTASSLTVALGFARDRVRHPLDGYGFVAAAESGSPVLACTWASSKFPGRAPPGHVLVRAFLDRADALAGREDAGLIALATEALRPLLGLEGAPVLAHVHRWRDALPRYAVGHLARVAEVERRLGRHAGLFLAGAGYRGPGVPDCVRDGESAADSARAFLAGGAAPEPAPPPAAAPRKRASA